MKLYCNNQTSCRSFKTSSIQQTTWSLSDIQRSLQLLQSAKQQLANYPVRLGANDRRRASGRDAGGQTHPVRLRANDRRRASRRDAGGQWLVGRRMLCTGAAAAAYQNVLASVRVNNIQCMSPRRWLRLLWLLLLYVWCWGRMMLYRLMWHHRWRSTTVCTIHVCQYISNTHK